MSDTNNEQTTDQTNAMPQTDAQPKPDAASTAVKWTVRCLVYGVLIVLLGLAGYDFYVKNQYEQTVNALKKKRDAIRNSEIKREDLERDVIVGQPEIVDGKNTPFWETKIYKWNGVFRIYRVEVQFRKRTSAVADWKTLAP